MAYKIIDLEGIGPVYAEKLVAAGVITADDLLERCAAPKGRKELAEATGITEKLILKWTNYADMFRIHGIGPQFAELLEAAGVDTVKELSHRVPANLAAKVAEVNAVGLNCLNGNEFRLPFMCTGGTIHHNWGMRCNFSCQ